MKLILAEGLAVAAAMAIVAGFVTVGVLSIVQYARGY